MPAEEQCVECLLVVYFGVYVHAYVGLQDFLICLVIKICYKYYILYKTMILQHHNPSKQNIQQHSVSISLSLTFYRWSYHPYVECFILHADNNICTEKYKWESNYQNHLWVRSSNPENETLIYYPVMSIYMYAAGFRKYKLQCDTVWMYSYRFLTCQYILILFSKEEFYIFVSYESFYM